jgi:hypothetical protein
MSTWLLHDPAGGIQTTLYKYNNNYRDAVIV